MIPKKVLFMENNFDITETEMPVPDSDTPPRPRSKRGVPVGAVVLISLLSVLITAIATFFITASVYSIDSESTLGKIFSKMNTLSNMVEKYYVRDVDEDTLVNYALKGYMYGLGDKYADYYTPEEYESLMEDLKGSGIGVGINVVYDEDHEAIQVVNVVKNSPADEAGVMAGDIITHITEDGNKLAVSDLGYTEAVDKMLGEIGTTAKFTVIRGEDYSETVEFSIVRAQFTNTSVMYHTYALDNSVGIIRITGFDYNTPTQFKEAAQNLIDNGAKAFIIDVRNNPGGELDSVCTVLDMLLPEGPIIKTVDKNGNETVAKTSDAEMLDIPLVVIANENTASAGELFCAALMDYDVADLVGTQTYGKGSMQTTFQLPDGSGIKLTTNLYNPPFSENYDGVGLTPDVEVEPNEALKTKNFYLITDEEDNQLAAAYRQLKTVN